MASLGRHGGLGTLTLILALSWLLTIAMPAKPGRGQDDLPRWPDVSNPGLDLGDFPNSAFTIPAGTCLVELAPFSYLGEDPANPAEYFTQFLLRFGLTDDVEFRILGNGLTATCGEPYSTGFSPLVLDGKIHLWDERREWFLPASSLEVALTTDWGASSLSSGYQPSIYLNFDLPLFEATTLEWTVGYGEVVGQAMIRTPRGSLVATDANLNQVSFAWSFGQELTDNLEVFLTGITAQPIEGQAGGTLLACGGFWRWSDRLSYFGSLGWGVTPDAPQFGAQLGLGIALGPALPRETGATSPQ